MDTDALQDWVSWLRPGGAMLLSVPARMKAWNEGDVWAGHFRRYEWAQFHEMVEAVGLKVERFECYGFPLANVTEMIGAFVRKKRVKPDGRQTNNDRSGVDRGPHVRLWPLLSSAPVRSALGSFVAVQRMFLTRDWGNGYLVLARKGDCARVKRELDEPHNRIEN